MTKNEPIIVKKENVVALMNRVNFLEEQYKELYSYLSDISTHLLGPTWYSYSCSGIDCAREMRDDIIAKYKKHK